jgi:hypothetical protein
MRFQAEVSGEAADSMAVEDSTGAAAAFTVAGADSTAEAAAMAEAADIGKPTIPASTPPQIAM